MARYISVSVYQRKDTKRTPWWLQWRVGHKRFRAPGGRTRAQADRAARAKELELNASKPGVYSNITMKELRDLWCTEWKTKKKSLERDKLLWDMIFQYIDPKTAMSDLSRGDCDLLKEKVANTPKKRGGGQRSIADVNRHMALLKAALRAALRNNFRHQDPMSGWQPDEEPKHRERIVSADELDLRVNGGNVKSEAGKSRVVKPAEPSLKAVILLGYWTLARLGEICDLCWSNIDLDARTAQLLDTKNGTRASERLCNRRFAKPLWAASLPHR